MGKSDAIILVLLLLCQQLSNKVFLSKCVCLVDNSVFVKLVCVCVHAWWTGVCTCLVDRCVYMLWTGVCVCVCVCACACACKYLIGKSQAIKF